MCANTDQQSYKGQCSETHPQLGSIASTRECCTESLVFLFTVVPHAHRKWPALVVDVYKGVVVKYFAAATFHQTIANAGLNSFDHSWIGYNKPSTNANVVRL